MRSRALSLAFAVLTATSAAFAQEPRREPSAADVHTARIALTEGMAQREKGDHLAALGRLQTAFDLVPTPITAFELGKTHMMLGHVLQAYDLFNRVTRMETRADESARAKSSRIEAARLASELEPRIPSLRIKLRLPPNATAVVRVDDETVATKGTETIRAVDPGSHKVVAKAGDGPEQTVSITVAEAETKDVELSPQWIEPAQKTVDGEKVYYTQRTNPVVFMGFATAGAAMIGTGFALSILSDSNAALDDKCGSTYCPPSTENDERFTRDVWFGLTVLSVASVGVGLFAAVYGIMNPIRERLTTGSNVRFGPTAVEWHATF